MRNLTVHDMIRELTADHPHAEPYVLDRNGETWSTKHHTQVPSLISQLTGATPQGSQEETGSRHGKSRPAARIESLDTVMLIDDEAGEWIDRLGYTIPSDKIDPETQTTIPGSGTIRRLNRLNGLYPNTEGCGASKPVRYVDAEGKPKGPPICCDRHRVEHDIRRWWQQARIITGWDTPAFRPRATCPVCDVHGSLRVKPDGALCIDCRSLWDAGQIGLLAEHIRSESAENVPDEAA